MKKRSIISVLLCALLLLGVLSACTDGGNVSDTGSGTVNGVLCVKAEFSFAITDAPSEG